MTSLEKFICVDIRDGNIVDTEEKRLTLAYEGLHMIPRNLIEDYGSIVETLDLSYNNIRHIEFLSQFEKLTSLILDHNLLDSEVFLPKIPSLTTLWLNNNLITKLYPLVERISKAFPNLKIISLMGNPGAPSYLNGGTYYEYLHYRLFIISWLPRLEYLDDKPVSEDQRVEARRLYGQPFYKTIMNASIPEYVQQIQDKVKARISEFSWAAASKTLSAMSRRKPSIRNPKSNLVI